MYKSHRTCRACGYGAKPTPPGVKDTSNEKLVPVLSLGIQPLANDFSDEQGIHAGFAPLEVLFCPRCTLAQLSVVVDPQILYRNYAYVTSKSETMKAHFGALHDLICDEANPKSVVEIGSNDGDLLDFFRGRGTERFYGIDPAANLAEVATQRGIPTEVATFGLCTARYLRTIFHSPDVIIARHVFGHVDDWNGFIAGLDLLSDYNTVVVIEVPHAAKLVANCEFDTIYHEHLSYISLRSIEHALKDTRFHIHRIEKFPIHGGAVVVMLRPNNTAFAPHGSVAEHLAGENVTLEGWQGLEQRMKGRIAELRYLVSRIKSEGKKVCAFGASAKSTVLINLCGFSRREIDFIADCTPSKQHKYSPGSNIPIVDEGALLRELPDYAIMCCWNFRDEVLERQKLYRDKGGKFIIPIPQVEIF